jgi:hypothetical protein
VVSRGVLRAAATVGLAAAAIGCGGGSSTTAPKPPDPVEMVLKAPGVRTVVIPEQKNALTVAVPPCTAADIDPETTRPPEGSNRIVVPKSTQEQTVAIPPCLEGVEHSEATDTVLVTPGGGAGSQQSAGQQAGVPQNQLLLPRNANLKLIIVPPCLVLTSSSASSGGLPSGITTTLPAAGGKTTVTAPACKVHMASSGSS